MELELAGTKSPDPMANWSGRVIALTMSALPKGVHVGACLPACCGGQLVAMACIDT